MKNGFIPEPASRVLSPSTTKGSCMFNLLTSDHKDDRKIVLNPYGTSALQSWLKFGHFNNSQSLFITASPNSAYHSWVFNFPFFVHNKLNINTAFYVGS